MTQLTQPLRFESIQEICRYISKITGVQLGERQESMVSSRLQRRALDLKLAGIEEYYPYFQRNITSETKALVSLLTTHHSFFFREITHFQFLAQTGLGNIIEAVRGRGDKQIWVWSAACSRGQESYSLAMFLSHHLERMAPDLSFEILGTDVDEQSVSIARNGVYHRNEIKAVPMQYLGDHWVRGSGDIADYVKARNSLKEHCRFQQRQKQFR